MSSRRGGGTSSSAGAAAADSTSKGKDLSGVTGQKVDQISHGVADIGLDTSTQNGEWEVHARKSKNRPGSNAGKPWGLQNAHPKSWGHPDAAKFGMRNNSGFGKGPGNAWPTQDADPRRSAGRGNTRPVSSSQSSGNNFVASQPVIPPPLEHGWKWPSRAAAAAAQVSEEVTLNSSSVGLDDNKADDSDDDSDVVHDSDDELLSDDYDSDVSQKSHETRKKNKWFKTFFEVLGNQTVEELNGPGRQWHCPACQGGPGAIMWYQGLQSLMTHAKTKGSTRMKLHRELAELLDEELRRRGTSVVPAGEAFGRWRGLSDDTQKDRQIVWPPMVVIMNTQLEQDENEKWIGMGNQELLDYFSSHAAVKARHSYGPQGHRGMSLLIFENSAMGYIEADRLSNYFHKQGTDRVGWECKRVLFYPGGKRQLYGFMAEKRDLDVFNQHCQGKSKLKFDMRSYQEMVVDQTRQMSEDNQQLIWFKNKVAKEQMHSKALEESFGIVSEKLRKTLEENRIVKQRFKQHHEQNKEEMDVQEQFYKDQISLIHKARDESEDKFEKMQQEQREKVKQSNQNGSSRAEEITNFIKSQDQEMEEFVKERDNLIKIHEDKKNEMKRRQWEEEVELEKEFDKELDCLMMKYGPDHNSNGR